MEVAERADSYQFKHFIAETDIKTHYEAYNSFQKLPITIMAGTNRTFGRAFIAPALAMLEPGAKPTGSKRHI